ncbi:hypothetical protein ACFFX0_03680 [Citricoccus parietis]|uniref:Uncharacterized protein n=1 Tax=Citricoccus parietis TaxID=592307 RepID=A0ABV5FUH1_9MICC
MPSASSSTWVSPGRRPPRRRPRPIRCGVRAVSRSRRPRLSLRPRPGLRLRPRPAPRLSPRRPQGRRIQPSQSSQPSTGRKLTQPKQKKWPIRPKNEMDGLAPR